MIDDESAGSEDRLTSTHPLSKELSVLHGNALLSDVGSAEPAATDRGLTKIHVVYKTHLDLGYTDLAVNSDQHPRGTR